MTDVPKRTAFVLMPFAVDFDDVYEHLIRSPLERAGYASRRADDLLNQRSILEDIVKSIADADLIVADLTSTNANVYYELGLAHALKKPVVLLAQDIGEVPFDLRPYRVVQYSTHFSKINEAVLRLQRILQEIHEGTMRFGSPFTDYEHRLGNDTHVPVVQANGDCSAESDPGPLGVFDYQVMFETAANEITAVMVEFGERNSRLTPEITSTAEQLSAPTPLPARAKQQIVQRLGTILDGHASWLKMTNVKFGGALRRLDESLSQILDHVRDEESSGENTQSLIAMLDQFQDTMGNTGASIKGFRDAVAQTPKLERTFIMASSRLMVELDELTGHFDQCVAVVSRWRSSAALFPRSAK